MRIAFTKTSMTHHALEIVRADGSREEALLETKCFMPHDLIHYALESEAGLRRSFWGLVGAGHSFVELNAKDMMSGAGVPRDELATTEMLVGALTGFLLGKAAPREFLAVVENMFGAHSLPMPAFMDEAFLATFSETMRRLAGRWRAAKKGEPMTLDWPELPARRPNREAKT